TVAGGAEGPAPPGHLPASGVRGALSAPAAGRAGRPGPPPRAPPPAPPRPLPLAPLLPARHHEALELRALILGQLSLALLVGAEPRDLPVGPHFLDVTDLRLDLGHVHRVGAPEGHEVQPGDLQ